MKVTAIPRSSFLQMLFDGPLSRKYKVSSVFGTRLDSVADGATIIVSALVLGLFFLNCLEKHWLVIAGLYALFGIQTVAALSAYKKVTSSYLLGESGCCRPG